MDLAFRCTVALLLAIGMGSAGVERAGAKPDGELTIQVIEANTGMPLAARIELQDSRKRVVNTRGLGLAKHGNHFYVDGQAVLGLRRGQYQFDLDAGWERKTRSGHFEIQRRSEDTKRIEMSAFADLVKEGWLAADLDCDRPLTDLGVVLRAEQLTYVPLTTWQRTPSDPWKETKRPLPRKATLPAGVFENAARLRSDQGDLLLFGPQSSISAEELSVVEAGAIKDLQSARQAGYRLVAADLTAWPLPVWLAHGVLDAACVLERVTTEPRVGKRGNGYPAPRARYPGPQGPGRWREQIYFHILNAGLRLPAVAGSGSGENSSPLGANRVYAQCGGEFTPDTWWESVLAGQTVVTSGPLLRPQVLGEPPGFTFFASEQEPFYAAIGLNLSTRTKVEYLDLIQNGEVTESVGLRDWANAGGKLPELDFTASGWFAVRAVTTSEDRYNMALSSPYYVSDDKGPRISRESCQFFLDWLTAMRENFTEIDDDQRRDMAKAERFWISRQKKSNAP